MVHARAFCTCCSLLRLDEEMPYSIELQWSSWDDTNAVATVFASSTDTHRRMWCRARMWKWAALHTLLTWSSKDRVLSIITLRLFTVLVTGTVTPATVTSSTSGSDLCLAVVPMTIALVLSDFGRRPLVSNQRWTDWKQLLIMPSALSVLRVMYSWVSSAYWTWWTFLKGTMTLTTGEVYIVNSRGPSTLPWGTW